MLLDRVPSEAELQPDLDVGAALGVELLSTLEVIAGEASPATGRLRGLAAGGTDGGLCDADLGSDLAGRHARASQIEDLLLLGRADRTTSRVANAAGFRGLARLRSRRYAGRAQFRSYLARDETLAEGEQGLPVVCVELAEAHYDFFLLKPARCPHLEYWVPGSRTAVFTMPLVLVALCAMFVMHTMNYVMLAVLTVAIGAGLLMNLRLMHRLARIVDAWITAPS